MPFPPEHINLDPCPLHRVETTMTEQQLSAMDRAGEVVDPAALSTPPAVVPAVPSDAVRKALERLVHDVRDLADNSHGVIGLHKNGDDAPWSELTEGGRYDDWLGLALEQADAALSQTMQPQAKPAAGEQAGAVGWLPIETGPTNVLVVALFRGKRPVIAHKNSERDNPRGWCHEAAFGSFDEPNRGLTHWMPLPPAPTSQEKDHA